MKIEITEKQLEFINESLLSEGGIRDINKLAQRYPKAEIYFHQDLDGVVSALGMKNYLEKYGIDVIDTHVIQYGDKEFSVKKPSASDDVMPVLVDFAHGKPIFKIHTDPCFTIDLTSLPFSSLNIIQSFRGSSQK